jgi:hypothetical protein
MIEMPVGIENELDRPVVERRDRSLDLVGERRELVID